MSSDKVLQRVRKLIELSKSTNEHEAAQAAARAADLMSEHAITEAMLAVVDDDGAANAYVKERIIEDGLPEKSERRIAWRDRIASAVSQSMGCERYYYAGNLYAVGRESAVAAWKYTAQYLIREVSRLADEAWLKDGADLAAVGERSKTWKGAFRLGAADTIANRLYVERRDREARERSQVDKQVQALPPGGGSSSGSSTALALVNKTLERISQDRAEVKAEFAKITEGCKRIAPIGQTTRGRGGYSAGSEAGKSVALNRSRGALKA